jgi:hypothetical protein
MLTYAYMLRFFILLFLDLKQNVLFLDQHIKILENFRKD